MTECARGGGESKEARLRHLQQLIESGDYHIPAIDIADAILRHTRSEAKVARSVRPAPDRSEDGPTTPER